jgi:hypothetical protein
MNKLLLLALLGVATLYGQSAAPSTVVQTSTPSSGVSMRSGGFAVMFVGANAVAGTTVYVTVPYACAITDWVISSDSTATVKLWRIADGGTVLPTVTQTLSTSGFGLSTGTRVHSTTLSDLSGTAIAAYDTFGVNLFAYGGTAGHVEFTLGCAK